ncbi:hypothetical protein B0H10DRAFT_1771430, partial [Mycena sp. CBHHK59/15]
MAFAFEDYITPLPSVKYSATYFGQLCFREAAQLKYPTIYSPKTISAWKFTNEVTNTSSVDVHGAIPHLEDLSQILKDMEAAFARGARSAAVTLTVAGKSYDHVYSFVQIQLFRYINNNNVAIQSARDLVDYLSSSSLLATPTLEKFLALPIHSKIFGFHVSDFPLWKLSCLLGEEWLHEDVLNVLAELLYFSAAAASDTVDPPHVILPTS